MLAFALLLRAGSPTPQSVPQFFTEHEGAYYSHSGQAGVELQKGRIQVGAFELRHLGARWAKPEAWGHQGLVRSYQGHNTEERRFAGSVKYEEIYPGISLRFSFESGHLKTDYLVSPRADSRRIRVRYGGAEQVSLRDGWLHAVARDGSRMEQPSPFVYQERADGTREQVAASYALHKDGSVSFSLGKYDAGRALVIDPYVVVSAAYKGGSGVDKINSIATDSSGNLYLAGSTDSTDFAPLPLAQGTDAFVMKLNASNQIVWATYLRGAVYDSASAIAIDGSSSVYVTGSTSSTDFYTVGASQSANAGSQDVFLAKLLSDGSLQFSTYFGGSDNDIANSLVFHSPSNEVWIAGQTLSSNFPVLAAIQGANAGGLDAFVSRFSSGGVLLASTYLGGGGEDRATAIAVGAGGVYLTGSTTSVNFPIASPARAANAGFQDAFVTKLNSAGTGVLYSTYLGGSGGTPGQPETGTGIAVDSNGSTYVAGITSSPNFPVLTPLQSAFGGGSTDAFLTRLNAAGAITFSSFWGGSGTDEASVVVLQSDGTVYVAGGTTSADLPLTDAIQTYTGSSGRYDGMLLRLNSSLDSVLLATYLGGTDNDTIISLTVNGADLVAAGYGSSPTLLGAALRGSVDGFFVRLQERPLAVTISADTGGTQFTVSGTNCSAATYDYAATMNWSSGATCSVSIPPVQLAGATSRVRFTRWGDGTTANPRVFSVPPMWVNYSLLFGAEYVLSLTANNAAYGSVGSNPASADRFYPAGTSVQITAVPQGGYQFVNWSGDYAGSANPLTVTLAAARAVTANFACVYSLSSASLSVSDVGLTSAFTIATGAACPWTATSNANWVAVTGGASGTGNGTVAFAVVANNTGIARSATIAAGGNSYVITQSATPTYPVSINMNPALAFTVSGANCSPGTYTGAASLTWTRNAVCTVSAGSPQTVGGVSYNFGYWQDGSAANPRNFNATGPASYSATGAPACSVSLSPSVVSTAASGETGTFKVITTPAGCQWSASVNVNWAQIYPWTGSGNATAEYTSFPNFSTSARSAAFQFGNQTFTVNQAAATGTFNQRIVKLIYFNFLGRLPSASEVQLQAGVLDKGTPPGQLVLDFFSTPEFNLGSRFVAGLYVGLLNRDAEYGGWLFQRTALMTTRIVTSDQLVANFTASAEYKLVFGSPTDAEYAQLLYRQVLLREASPGEITIQVNGLHAGITRVQLANAFLNSAEFRIGTGSRLSGFLLYACLLSRHGSPPEQAAIVQRIAGGVPLRQLVDEILASPEFSALLR